jgi:hypothetical protein
MNKPFAIAFAAAIASAAAPALSQELLEGYTCCNLHHDNKGSISDANWKALPMIRVGARIKVLEYGSNSAAVEIDGKPMRLVHENGRRDESLEQYVRKLVVAADPRRKIANYPKPIWDAIREGRAIPGMTREQVLIAIGYPPTNMTPSVESNPWNYLASRTGRYEVHFNREGIVERLKGFN